jgi:hypothetical protein
MAGATLGVWQIVLEFSFSAISVDDETGVEFTIIHTFVNPPKRDEAVDMH